MFLKYSWYFFNGKDKKLLKKYQEHTSCEKGITVYFVCIRKTRVTKIDMCCGFWHNLSSLSLNIKKKCF